MMHDGWMLGMGWGWILLLLLIIAAIWIGIRLAARGSVKPEDGRSPEDVLRDRLARGEIDEDEYRSRTEVLRQGS